MYTTIDIHMLDSDNTIQIKKPRCCHCPTAKRAAKVGCEWIYILGTLFTGLGSMGASMFFPEEAHLLLIGGAMVSTGSMIYVCQKWHSVKKEWDPDICLFKFFCRTLPETVDCWWCRRRNYEEISEWSSDYE